MLGPYCELHDTAHHAYLHDEIERLRQEWLSLEQKAHETLAEAERLRAEHGSGKCVPFERIVGEKFRAILDRRSGDLPIPGAALTQEEE